MNGVKHETVDLQTVHGDPRVVGWVYTVYSSGDLLDLPGAGRTKT